MSRSRRSTQSTIAPAQRPLKVVASGTLFVTHVLGVPSLPEPGGVLRAHSVAQTRGGAANIFLSILAQFPSVEALLVAPLGGNHDGKIVLENLRRENINIRHCKIWDHAGVPSAWVLNADDTDARAVINHNPLPDITHTDFVSLLGPLLAPENYPESLTPPSARSSPAPFDWLHFEGRSIRTTLANMTSVAGLAVERSWRRHCVFSLDVGPNRQGVEALIPHADVVFLSQSSAAAYDASTPRALLLTLAPKAARHALLVTHWGATSGAALLAVPTREYLQASPWTPPPLPPPPATPSGSSDSRSVRSVRTESEFWAGEHTASANGYSAFGLRSPDISTSAGFSPVDRDFSGVGGKTPEPVLDEVGAQDAFVAGMVYALSRRILPGPPFAPKGGVGESDPPRESDSGRWKLDECLRFATELAGRRARKQGWEGLADEMIAAGWPL